MPRLVRYCVARSVHSEAKHRWMATSRASLSVTLRKVSCCPAKEASGRSSAVAEERTVTGMDDPAERVC
jgi:hypothetical protein